MQIFNQLWRVFTILIALNPIISSTASQVPLLQVRSTSKRVLQWSYFIVWNNLSISFLSNQSHWGSSSNGRAPVSHTGGNGIDARLLHSLGALEWKRLNMMHSFYFAFSTMFIVFKASPLQRTGVFSDEWDGLSTDEYDSWISQLKEHLWMASICEWLAFVNG
jgi:hypothetical protein